MKAKFEITHLLEIKDELYVFARLVSKETSFQLSNHAFLAGVAIENWTDMPRLTAQEGKPDLFAFVLKHKADQARLPIGKVVELRNEGV